MSNSSRGSSLEFFIFSLIVPRPPNSSLFPYTTLFRSQNVGYSNFSQPQSHLSFCVLLQYLVERRRVVTQILKQNRSEERFSRNAETDLVCRLLLEKKNKCKSRAQQPPPR